MRSTAPRAAVVRAALHVAVALMVGVAAAACSLVAPGVPCRTDDNCPEEGRCADGVCRLDDAGPDTDGGRVDDGGAPLDAGSVDGGLAADAGALVDDAGVVADAGVVDPRLQSDADTLLLLRFDEDLEGVGGEVPTTTSTGVSFVGGRFGSAVHFEPGETLAYPVAGNVSSSAGTIELWLRTDWPGTGSLEHVFLDVCCAGNDGMRIAIDGANNLRFIRWGDAVATVPVEVNEESDIGSDGTFIVAGAWNHFAYTWDDATGIMAMHVNGDLAVSNVADAVMPSFTGTELFVGGRVDALGTVQGAIDELRISSRARSGNEIMNDYLRATAP